MVNKEETQTHLDDLVNYEKFSKVEEVHRFLSEEIEYDSDAIIYDENGCILEVVNKTPNEVVKSKKTTCIGGVFYSARELRNDFGEDMISLYPIVRKGKSKSYLGLPHAMYLFNLNGFYGAISKSREELLSFVHPSFINVESLVLSSQIISGYDNLFRLRGEKLLRIGFLVYGIKEEFPYYEFDVTRVSIEGKRESIKWHNLVKESLEYRENLEKMKLCLEKAMLDSYLLKT